ncbi:sugar kinase [Paenibacillus timonensis]|uniref:Sugar kinase n=1 Tax=Paenibacillus timonensis TaxID=225915 RepID=A0ABW3SGS1_9BACL|nr:sugar kinase [Paenibacillus timonensis]MCH1641756.1 sugar kinase [Paenibacillus timonensis]GJM78913.1 2-dehydro-3-deoxygluconokinase [Paenibacillus sp. HMSSN-139]
MPKRIAAFGEVMMRLQVPGYETLAQGDTLKYSFSGTGVNVASALSRYGHAGSLVTRLPDNPLGDAASAYLRKLGIDTARVLRGGKYVGMYFLENGFGVRPSRVTYSNRLESSFNTAPEGTYDFEEIAAGVDAVHFCGITLAMNDGVRAHMKSFAEAVKRRGGMVIFDCNYRPSLWGEGGYAKAKPHYEAMLRLADIVMMNEKDAMLTLGMTTARQEREDQLAELIPAVAESYGISAIAGTHRRIHGDNSHSLRGFLYKGERFVFSDRLTFSVYDRIGAGDAFASGIIHGELEGFAPERTVRFAAAAGMLAHTVPGDTPMATEAEILRAMEQSAAGDVER